MKNRRFYFAAAFTAGLGVCVGLLLGAVFSPSEDKLRLFTVCTGAWLAFCIFTAVCGAFLARPAPERLYALLVVMFGAAYLFLITPLSVPDEQHHYQMAQSYAGFVLSPASEQMMTEAGYLRYSGFASHRNVSSGYLRVLTDLFSPLEEHSLVPAPEGDPAGYAVCYLPQTAALVTARLLRLGMVPTFLLGRLFNLLFYAGCVYLAISAAPRYKTLFGVTALLPMALQQAASWSYDSFTNGMSLLYFALVLRSMMGDGPLSRKEYLCLLAAAVLLAPAKGSFLPVLAVGLIPAARFKNHGEKWLRLGALMMIAAAVMMAVQLPVMLDDPALERELNWEGEYNYSLSFVLSHPGETARIFFRTLAISLSPWIQQALGRTLSGLSLQLPARLIGAQGFVLLLAASRPGEPESAMTPARRIFLLAISAGMVLFVMGVMLLAWTSETRQTIQGVQGRYFLPVTPMAAVALGLPVPRLKRDVRALFPVAEAVLQCAVLWMVLQYTLAH